MYEKASICLLRRVFRNISSSSPSFFGKNRKPKSVILITYLILFCYFFSLSFQMLDILVWMEVAFFFRCVYVEFDLSLPSYAKSDVRRRVTQEFAVDFFLLSRSVCLAHVRFFGCLFVHPFFCCYFSYRRLNAADADIHTPREREREKASIMCGAFILFCVCEPRACVCVCMRMKWFFVVLTRFRNL